jgi:hypothetical protein
MITVDHHYVPTLALTYKNPSTSRHLTINQSFGAAGSVSRVLHLRNGFLLSGNKKVDKVLKCSPILLCETAFIHSLHMLYNWLSLSIQNLYDKCRISDHHLREIHPFLESFQLRLSKSLFNGRSGFLVSVGLYFVVSSGNLYLCHFINITNSFTSAIQKVGQFCHPKCLFYCPYYNLILFVVYLMKQHTVKWYEQQ